MANSLSIPLAAHYTGEVTTLASCLKATLHNGTIYGFSSHTSDLIFEGVTFEAASGYTPSTIASNADLAVDNLEVVGFLDSEKITEADIQAGLWDFASIDIFEVNYNDLTMGARNLRSGTIGEIKIGRQQFISELRGIVQQLQQIVGDLYSATCRAELGDDDCGIDKSLYTVTGAVTVVTDNRTFSDSTRSEAANYFNGGKITWTSGENIGLSMEVKTFSSGAFLLQLKMPYAVAVDDTYSVYPGCNKILKTGTNEYLGDCKVKFDNAPNFRGECETPGLDFILKPAGKK